MTLRCFLILFIVSTALSGKAIFPVEKNTLQQNQHKLVPENDKSPSVSPEVDNFLKALNGQMRLLLCKYDGAKLVKSQSFEDSSLKLNGNEWLSSVEIDLVPEDKTALDLQIGFRLERGNENSAGVAVVFDFSDWGTENYVLLPASVYNGNRCELVDRAYNAGLDRKYLC